MAPGEQAAEATVRSMPEDDGCAATGEANGRASALDGVTVLDLTRFYSGPFATLLLAGYGAEVIRIDRPSQGEPAMSGPPFLGRDGVSLERRDTADLGLAYLKRCRGKKSITLNLESAQGLAIFRRLLRTADVVVENFRPGFAEKLGVDYASNAAVNPRIVHCAITGYGSTGPDRGLKAYDLMIQADSGLMSITGDPDGPARKAGSALSDGISGVFATSAILAALVERQRSGEGQFVDVSMVDCLVSLVLDEPLDCYDALGQSPRQGNRIMRFSPFDTFRTLDGEVAIGVATETEWRALIGVIGREDLLDDARFMDAGWRVAHNREVGEIVAGWTRTRTTVAALTELRCGDVPASPIRTMPDLMAWEHLRRRNMLERVSHPTMASHGEAVAAGFPVKLGRTPGRYAGPAPVLAEHNVEVYGGRLGLSEADLRRLQADGII